ncbi:hypothetical protein [Isoptericola sp. 178]|uniref:DUF6912 family protein n=1 Tax=Isoptericola sp. 178 TaxID=3064651 RepID=UPI0027129570|nr:hypothetical protein [Isoptericola sp. 178]MDO8144179.1 hypothetical protein [Isoptericola sp. 178]
MRIYVPATLDELDTAVVGSVTRWPVGPRGAHAVTRALAGELADADDEGREYAAFLAAADDSLSLVAGRPGVPPVRVVVSVDVEQDVVGVDPEGASASSVQLLRDVPDVPLAAVHVDEPTAADDVRAVLAAVDADDDEALAEAVQRVTDRDLLWYDPSEVGQIPRP